MFTGVFSHHDAKRVHNFETARAALERASRSPGGRTRAKKYYGFHLGMNRNHGVTWVRETSDGAIAFRLYETDVVTWHPDESVVICNFGTVTTSGFAARFLPGGISLNYQTERRGASGGNRGIIYRPAVRDGDDRRICRGHAVRFVPDSDGFVPDETTLLPITLPRLDVAAARGIGRRYHFKDFENWLAVAPHHMRVDYDGFDLDECLLALVRRDFTAAAAFLPLVTIPNGWGAADRIKPLPIDTGATDNVVTLGSIAKLRVAIQEEIGAIVDETQPTWLCSEYARGMTLVRTLASVDVGTGRYGAD